MKLLFDKKGLGNVAFGILTGKYLAGAIKKDIEEDKMTGNDLYIAATEVLPKLVSMK